MIPMPVVRPQSARSIRRLRERFVLVMLIAFSTVVTHQVTYVLANPDRHAYERAMSSAGHDGWWLPLAFAIIVGLVGLGCLATRELLRLGRLSQEHSVGRDEGWSIAGYVRIVASLWMRLALVTAIVYGVQENLEHVATGEAVPGLDVLAVPRGLPIMVILGVSLVIAAIVGLARWRRGVFLARIAAARLHPAVRGARGPRPEASQRAPLDSLCRLPRSRAPPQPALPI